MLAIELMQEAAALAGYTIGSTGQDATNKTRALRRLNVIKADIIARYGGKWPSNYREGWLALHPLAPCLATFTFNSYTVTVASDGSTLGDQIFLSGVPSYMVGAKILASDGSYYKIAAVDATHVYLDTPFQGTTASGVSTTIWNDEYTVYPDVLGIGSFVNYSLVQTMREAWVANFKDSYSKQTSSGNPDVYEVIGRKQLSAIYTTGTISGSVNSNVLTGSGTAWKSNVEPGYEVTIGTTKYHIKTVDSDTQVTLYQMLNAQVSASTYSMVGKNALIVRFKVPTSQIVVHYWYWAKDRPFVNDSDEDWVAELYPRVIVNGMSYFDYIDKNDVIRGRTAQETFEDSIKNMRVAQDTSYTGVRTIGLYLPPEARE